MGKTSEIKISIDTRTEKENTHFNDVCKEISKILHISINDVKKILNDDFRSDSYEDIVEPAEYIEKTFKDQLDNEHFNSESIQKVIMKYFKECDEATFIDSLTNDFSFWDAIVEMVMDKYEYCLGFLKQATVKERIKNEIENAQNNKINPSNKSVNALLCAVMKNSGIVENFNSTVKGNQGWFTGDWDAPKRSGGVNRLTVFQIAFAFKLTAEETSELLFAAQLEDFDIKNYEDAVYEYCLNKQYSYDKAKEMLDNAEKHLIHEEKFDFILHDIPPKTKKINTDFYSLLTQYAYQHFSSDELKENLSTEAFFKFIAKTVNETYDNKIDFMKLITNEDKPWFPDGFDGKLETKNIHKNRIINIAYAFKLTTDETSNLLVSIGKHRLNRHSPKDCNYIYFLDTKQSPGIIKNIDNLRGAIFIDKLYCFIINSCSAENMDKVFGSTCKDKIITDLKNGIISKEKFYRFVAEVVNKDNNLMKDDFYVRITEERNSWFHYGYDYKINVKNITKMDIIYIAFAFKLSYDETAELCAVANTIFTNTEYTDAIYTHCLKKGLGYIDAYSMISNMKEIKLTSEAENDFSKIDDDKKFMDFVGITCLMTLSQFADCFIRHYTEVKDDVNEFFEDSTLIAELNTAAQRPKAKVSDITAILKNYGYLDYFHRITRYSEFNKIYNGKSYNCTPDHLVGYLDLSQKFIYNKDDRVYKTKCKIKDQDEKIIKLLENKNYPAAIELMLGNVAFSAKRIKDILNRNVDIQRTDIVLLVFLKYLIKHSCDYEECFDIKDFEDKLNKVLDKCRFRSFYLRIPVDRIIYYILCNNKNLGTFRKLFLSKYR